MNRHIIHTTATAAPAARDTLAVVEEAMGFVPNIFAVLGGAPTVLDALAAMNARFADGGLDAIEREIVQLAVSAHNGCGYCVAGHSAFATAHGMSVADLAALRYGRPLDNSRHEALRRFAHALAAGKGRGAEIEFDAFLREGYTAEQAFEVILGVAVKTFTNTLATFVALPLDEGFRPFAWSQKERHPAAA